MPAIMLTIRWGVWSLIDSLFVHAYCFPFVTVLWALFLGPVSVYAYNSCSESVEVHDKQRRSGWQISFLDLITQRFSWTLSCSKIVYNVSLAQHHTKSQRNSKAFMQVTLTGSEEDDVVFCLSICWFGQPMPLSELCTNKGEEINSVLKQFWGFKKNQILSGHIIIFPRVSDTSKECFTVFSSI